MSQFNTSVVYKVTQEAKGNNLELGYLYFKNVPVNYAQVLKAGKKYQSEDLAYQLHVFINADTAERLNEFGVNKEFAEVGVTKIAKGKNRGKVKYKVGEDHPENEPYEGMFAAQLTRETVKRDKKTGEITKTHTPLKVVDAEGEEFFEEVGNGSICTIKCFTYRNEEDMLVLMMDTVVVVDHVPCVREDNSFDEELGITIKPSTKTAKKEAAPVDEEEADEEIPVKAKPKAKVKPAPVEDDEDFDSDDLPF